MLAVWKQVLQFSMGRGGGGLNSGVRAVLQNSRQKFCCSGQRCPRQNSREMGTGAGQGAAHPFAQSSNDYPEWKAVWLVLGGGQGGGHDGWMDCCLQLVAPIDLSQLTPTLSLNPLHS